MSDIMSGKVENGLKILKMGAACLVFPFGNLHQKKVAVSLFLGTAVMQPIGQILRFSLQIYYILHIGMLLHTVCPFLM